MHQIQNEKHFLRLSLTGIIDQFALYEAQKDLMLHPEYPHKNSLWVFDHGCSCNFSHIGMLEMASRIKTLFPIGGTKKKGALLVGNAVHFGFIKMFCDEVEHMRLPFTMKPFISLSQATSWLIESEA
jgi:hypothetical protein